jgi:hypothetical protein
MTHRHAYHDPGGCVEIAPNVCLRPTVHGGDPDVTDAATGLMAGGQNTHLAGFVVAHDRAGIEARCEGAVTVDPHFGARWTMTGSLEGGDLTLTPSILCRLGSGGGAGLGECGFHGFVQNGAWVPA